LIMVWSRIRSATALCLALSLLSGCGKVGETVEFAELPAAGPPAAANQAPTIGGVPPRMIKIGVSYTFTPSASDPDSDQLTFSITNRPNWADFDNSTGTLAGVASLGSVGTYNDVVISVSDGEMSAALPAFSITVESTTTGNMPPEISGTPKTSVIVGNTYSFTPAASDPDGDLLTFSVVNNPSWASFDPSSGEISGTPQTGDVGQYNNVAITVSDGQTTSSLPAFNITVIAANTPPEISGTPNTSVTAGGSYSFAPTASDPDGDSLTFTIQNRPPWASFNGSTGQLTGTPTQGDVGIYNNIMITVSDSELSASLPAFNIEVTQPSNRPPTISGVPGNSVTVGTTYSFTPAASDPDGDSLTFSIQNQPSWASFNSATGQLTGVPSQGNVGLHNNIAITVSDGQLSASLPAFNIEVTQIAPTNRAPTISGVPASTVDVGTTYSFTPAASDPDGDTLTFSIQNRPIWASFDGSTGRLTGTPSQGDVGAYNSIGITVTDGQQSASLPPFSIDVAAIALGSVTLSWTPPTVNTDGSALTDLTAYKFYYGLSEGNYPNEIRVDNPGIATYVVEDLAPNTYYFVVTAVNSSGIESVFSNFAVKAVSP